MADYVLQSLKLFSFGNELSSTETDELILNHLEVGVIRYNLRLTTTEAATEIGWCSPKQWIKFEDSDSNEVPAIVHKTLISLASLKYKIVAECEKYYQDEGSNSRGIKFYRFYSDFIEDYPRPSIISWRLHQAICQDLIGLGCVRLYEQSVHDPLSPLTKCTTACAIILSERLVSH